MPGSPGTAGMAPLRTVDDVLANVGEFGPRQRFIYFFVSMAWLPSAWSTLLPVFTAGTPPWSCRHDAPPPAHRSHFDVRCDGNVTDVCELARAQWSFSDGGVRTSVASEWDIVCSDDYLLGIAGSLYFLGFLIGAGAGGALADKFGRRPTLLTTLLLMVVLNLACAASPSFVVYATLRFLLGIPNGAHGIAVFVLPSEFIGSSWRALTGSWSTGFFSVSFMLLPVVSLIFPGWRALTVAAAVSPLPWLLAAKWIPESPRWLLMHGHVDSCMEHLERIAAANGKPLPPCDFAPAASSTASEEGEGSDADKSAKQVSATDLFTKWPVMRRWTLVMMAAWFASSFGYYGLSLNSGSLGPSLHVNVVLSGLVELPACALAAFQQNRAGWGRRVGAWYLLVSGTACVVCIFLDVPPACLLPEAARTAVDREIACGVLTVRTAIALVGKLFIAAAFAVVFVHGSEIFPTSHRMAGMGLSSLAARAGGIAAPLAILLGHVQETLPYVLFGAVCLSSGAAYYYALPETLNKPMPETLADAREMYLRDRAAATARRAGTPRNGRDAADAEQSSSLLRSGARGDASEMAEAVAPGDSSDEP